MKIQEAIMRAMAGKITWYEAAEILGISCQQLRRMKEKWEEHGYDGLFDRRRGTPSPKRVPVATVQEVVRLYQEQYHDFNVKHFHEKLVSEHQIKLSYTWVKTALQMAGLVNRVLIVLAVVQKSFVPPKCLKLFLGSILIVALCSINVFAQKTLAAPTKPTPTPTPAPALTQVAHDSTLEGNGTAASPLGVSRACSHYVNNE